MLNKIKQNHGFTMVELLVVVTMMGFSMMAVSAGYQQYYEKKQAEHNRQAADTVMDAVIQYFATYQRYPCVASMAAASGTAEHGEATDCTDTSVAPGTCSADYCVAARMIDHDGDALTPDVPMRVRIGNVPFKELHKGLDAPPEFVPYADRTPPLEAPIIGGGDTLDAYGARMTYAVAENLVTQGYIGEMGGIRIQDEFDRVIDDRAEFVLVIHGRDNFGAVVDDTGRRIPCGNGIDAENCDGDAVFVDSLKSDAAGASYYDDELIYRAWVPYYHWDVVENSPADIYNLNSGNVGIGVSYDPAPQEKLHIKSGNLVAFDLLSSFPSYGPYRPTNLQADQICDESGQICFPVSAIAGDMMAEPFGGDMEDDSDDVEHCNTNTVPNGIAFSKMTCSEELFSAAVSENCPGGCYVKGYTYNIQDQSFDMRCYNPISGSNC